MLEQPCFRTPTLETSAFKGRISMGKAAAFHRLPILQIPIANNRSRDIPLSANAFRRERPVPTSSSSTLAVSASSHYYNDSRKLESLGSVKQAHAQMVKMDEKSSLDAFEEELIQLYLKFGDLRSAAFVFFLGFLGYGHRPRSFLHLSSLLEEFDKVGRRSYELLMIFGELHQKGSTFGDRILRVVLKMCAEFNDFWLGVEIHAFVIKKGLDLDVHLKRQLMSFYESSWGLEYADKVFEEMPTRNILLWNEAIAVNSRSGMFVRALHLFREMQFSFVKANSFTIVKILQVCGILQALEEGRQIHGYVIRSVLDSNFLVCNSLVSMYARNSKLEPARTVFNLIDKPTSTSWNSIISGYALNGCLNKALQLFQEMKLSEAKPDIITWNSLLSGHILHNSCEKVPMILHKMQNEGFELNSSSITSVLQAVSDLESLSWGKEVHGYAMRNGLEQDVYVGTSLVDMYLKCFRLTDARAVFNYMKNKNVFAWNSMISGYAFNGHFEEALRLLNQMEQEGINPDIVTWNGLISGYSMWDRSSEALILLQQMKSSGVEPNVVSWTALISGCCQSGNYRDSLEYFMKMQQEGIRPNSATISSLLRACAGMSLLQKGEEIHCAAIRKGFFEDPFVVTALIDMYCKSGSLKNGRQVFHKISNKSLASWNSMMMGFAIHGLGKDSILLFNEMCDVGTRPDSISFTALLSGCKHSGLIDDAWKYFDSISKDFNMIPSLEHYACMVDLLGRGGYLDEAWDFIKQMPLEPDASVWGALLGSCRIHKNLELAEIAAKYLFKLEPYNSANYILMINLYTIANRREDAENLRDLMSTLPVKSRPGWSWIQIDNRVHVFSVEGKPHPAIGEIYFELYHLVSKMKKLGYVPDTSCVLQNISEEEKEVYLLSHTEKLAITYGLIRKEGYGAIRVITNTRVCLDCHEAVKYMSQVSCREIFLRDGARFHHFRDGKCSCNDYW